MLTPPLTTPPPRRRIRIPVWSVLVTLLSILAAVIIIPRLSAKPPYKPYDLQGKTLITKRGSRTKMTLPDGTQVWLNADSHLTYDISRWTRKVQLQGEAYFIVSKNALSPFLIHTKMLDLRSSGGAVNVNVYDENSEVDVIDGPISATLSTAHLSPRAVTTLKIRSGDKLMLHATDTLPLIGSLSYDPQDSVYNETAWIRNKLSFATKNMAELRPMLERWYDVKITLTGTMLNYQYYTAVINDPGLQKTMELLSETNPFSFTIDNDKKEVHVSAPDFTPPPLLSQKHR